jgi:hypothetical protein
MEPHAIIPVFGSVIRAAGKKAKIAMTSNRISDIFESRRGCGSGSHLSLSNLDFVPPGLREGGPASLISCTLETVYSANAWARRG